MRMKKTIYAYAIASTMAAIMVIGLSHSANDVAASVPFSTKHDLEKLEKIGYKVSHINLNAYPTIPKSQAIESAKKTFTWAPERSNKIEVEYHAFTAENFQMFSEEAKNRNKKLKEDGYIKDLPVYIVSFKGTQLDSSRGGPGRTPHEELNVIVDAMTGEVLMGFNYR